MTDNASLVYVPHESVEVANTRVVRVDRSGVPQPLPLQPGPYRFVSVSPDDERIVVASSNTIWISDRGISRLSELLLPPGFTGGWWARWNLESSRVVFQNHSGTALLSALADGSGGDPDRLVTGLAGPVAMPNDWMADGSLVFTYGASGLARMGVSNGESGDWLPFMDRGRGVANAAIRAPQREWIAYDDQENNEIFLEHVSGAGGRFPVTGVGGGTSPVWANNSNELFYWRPPGTMMAVSIDTSSSVPKIDIPVELFPTDGYVIWQERNWDIDAKDNFYLVEWMDRRQTDNVERRIMRISNWDLELDRLAPLP
jgi:hypothetical protein